MVITYGPDDLDHLVADKGIVRNTRKIEAGIENARIMRRLSREHGSFHLSMLAGQSALS
ncbi:MAG: DNA-3-methyladenine glycosylase I [Anaerolineae bacterium]|nr:DNA-3-methyladenine glycosylase I [Anaerolineae bacterium]